MPNDYPPPFPEAGEHVISGWLEREAKYSSKWANRYVAFDAKERKLYYGESDKKVKAVLRLERVYRKPQEREYKSNDKNLLTMVVAGNDDAPNANEVTLPPEQQGASPDLNSASDPRPKWTLRFPDPSVFNEWYRRMRDALAAIGAMEPYECGLPPEDPRSGLTFASLPVESLCRFSLLERAIFFHFSACMLCSPADDHASSGDGATPDAQHVISQLHLSSSLNTHYFMIGDKYVYLFRVNADVVRCFAITSITWIVLGDNFFALGINDQADVLVKNTTHGKEIVSMLKTLGHAIRGNNKGDVTEEVWSQPIEELITTKPLSLYQKEGYKLQIVSPTPKTRLKQALDAYERQNGAGSPQSPKPQSPSGGGAKAQSDASRARQDSFSNVNVQDPLSQLLFKLNLPQYIRGLKKQHIDLDVISCMEPTDLANFGIGEPAHRELIVEAATEGFEAVKAKVVVVGQSASAAPQGDDLSGPLESVESFDLGSVERAPAAAKKNVVVNLSSDDDEDLPPPRPAAAQKIVISLDSDSDDDLDLLPIAKANVPAASPPPGERPVINLSDDDDI